MRKGRWGVYIGPMRKRNFWAAICRWHKRGEFFGGGGWLAVVEMYSKGSDSRGGHHLTFDFYYSKCGVKGSVKARITYMQDQSNKICSLSGFSIWSNGGSEFKNRIGGSIMFVIHRDKKRLNWAFSINKQKKKCLLERP